MDMNTPLSFPAAQLLVRKAARALGRHGLLHAYGHCSLRLDEDRLLVCAPQPPGTIGFGVSGIVIPLRGEFPADLPGELRIHREIYRARPGIHGVACATPPRTLSLSAMRRTPRILHGLGVRFAPAVPLWEELQVIHSDVLAAALVDRMGQGPAIVVRGIGAVTCGRSLQEAVALAWCLEDAARIDLDCLQAGLPGVELNAAETAEQLARDDRSTERLWDYLTHGDAEV